MTDFLEELAQLISDELSFTPGTDLFIAELPRGVNGVYMIATPTQEPDKETPVKYQTVDFWARNNKTPTAFSNLNALYNFFNRKEAYVTTNYEVYFSHALGEIEDVDRDIENGKLMRVSILFIIRSLIS